VTGRGRLFVANWKMHKTREEAHVFRRELARRLDSGAPGGDLVVAPPFTALDAAADADGRWSLAAQDVSSERSGAFTGEVSAAMVRDAGCRYAIIGHSERRRIFGEREDVLRRKLERVWEVGLVPIYCVGETGDERLAGETGRVLERQAAALVDFPEGDPLVVAYEPVWAIGTGVAATPADAAAAGELLLAVLPGRPALRVLYGGSVVPENAGTLLAGSGMDGFLIGGASLTVEGYAAIAGLPPGGPHA